MFSSETLKSLVEKLLQDLLTIIPFFEDYKTKNWLDY